MRSNLYKAYTIISRGKLPWLWLSCFLSRLQSKDVTDQSTYVSLFNVVFFLGRTRNPLSPSPTSVRSQSVPQPDKSMGKYKWWSSSINEHLPWLHFGSGWGRTVRGEGAPPQSSVSPLNLKGFWKATWMGRGKMPPAIMVDLTRGLM